MGQPARIGFNLHSISAQLRWYGAGESIPQLPSFMVVEEFHVHLPNFSEDPSPGNLCLLSHLLSPLLTMTPTLEPRPHGLLL
jgi:hypothetical protein